jgi:hypothetical protein
LSWHRRLTRRETLLGLLGWIGLVLYVEEWDRRSPVSLSRVWGEALEHPIAGPVIIALWGWVTSHLFLRKPERILIRW